METMETRATEGNILKYLGVLKSLKLILDNTSKLSMMSFSENNNVSKNLSTVMQRGGVIKMTKQGRYPEWKWISIEPNRHMAIKVLKEFTKLNPPRERKENKQKTLFDKQEQIKQQIVKYYEIKFFFGLITFKIRPHFIRV
jgi:hypothetical protein